MILPSIHFSKTASRLQPLGALPARMRRKRLLIVGCGDVGSRVARDVRQRLTVRALTSSADRVAPLRALGTTPLQGNLDDPRTLKRLGALAHWAVHLAPPQASGVHDMRTQAIARVWLRSRALAQARERRMAALPSGQRLARLRLRHQHTQLAALVYGSTSGVYGDCQGDWVDETRAVNAQSPRAMRRVSAELTLRRLTRQSQAAIRTTALRIPGIYAPDREGGTPRGRLERAVPTRVADEDVYTNHIHADDLARALTRALFLGKPLRTLNVCDDTVLKAGDYFDAAADLYGLPRPPRLSTAEVRAQITPMQWSFLRESRRLRNGRMKRELGLVLRHPHVLDGLRG